jgi:hyperosmotically inducible protein
MGRAIAMNGSGGSNTLNRKFLTGFLAAGILAFAAQQPTQPDNTKVNQKQSNKTTNADRAKDNTSDRDLMQKIRKAIMDDSSLSSYGHNVKVIAKNGKVTLKGPVNSTEEKQSISQKATEVAGAGNVSDEMTVKPKKSS